MTTQEEQAQKFRVEFRLKDLLAQRPDPATGKPMSGRELSRRTGIRHRSIHYLMNGKAKEIPFANLALICTELNCSPADLMVLVPDDDSDDAAQEVLARTAARRQTHDDTDDEE